MTVSNLASEFIDVGKHYGGRYYPITRVTIHHMAGVTSGAACARMHRDSGVDASANYYIGNDGDIVCGVLEENAPWTSSSWDNDNRAITIEVSNSYYGEPWPISDAAWKALISLVADICTRYGITPAYDSTPYASFTSHWMFAATGCPGTYIIDRMPVIVDQVTKAMGGTSEGWVYSEAEKKWWYQYADGSWAVGWTKIISGTHGTEWYFFDNEGWMKTGWLDWNGKKYYLQPRTKTTGTHYGYMVTGSKKIGGKIYYFMPGDDGSMISDCFRQAASGNWYCYGKDGARVMDASGISFDKKTGAITIG